MTHKQALPDAAIKASSEQLEKALSSEERVLTGHTDSVTCMILDESQQHVPYMLLITGSWDRTLRIWNLDSGECDGVLQGATASVRCMQRYGGDVLIAGEMKGSISLWNWKTRQLLRTIDAHPEDHAVMSIDVKGDILVSGGTDAKIKVRDPRSRC